MDVLLTHGAGLDVHKKTVMACRVPPDPTGEHADGVVELKACGVRTADLILEGECTVFLVNAAHVKQVPGRKTDKSDARWLARLMRYGLLPASFIPPQGQRDLRDLTRYRTQLVQERNREVNRVQGVLERANIKLASVATDVMGVSGRAIVAALVEGQADPATMAELAKGRLRSKMPLLEPALTGLVRDHHRQLLTLQLAHIDFLDEQIDTLSVEIMRRLTALGPGLPSQRRGRRPAPQGAWPTRTRLHPR